MPSNWPLFDRIRALTKQNRLYQAERIAQDQSSLDKLAVGGTLGDNTQSAILEQTNLQINRLERYKDYEQMDQTGEISLALDLYADEGSMVDSERKHTIVIRARNRRLKKELEYFFYDTLLWDSHCRPTLRYLCKYGDMPFEIVPSQNRDAVSSLKFISVYDFTRIETRFGDLVGFFHMDPLSSEPQFLHPWQVVHMRLTSFENIFNPYGRSILDGGRKAFKQLRLMEDAALIYRLTRAPEKRVFKIPVGMIPAQEVPEYMQMIARNFKRQRFYNPTTGTFDERYSPIVQEDDFFLPRRPDGSGPEIETLAGAQNLDQIADIEYFKKKMIAPMKIPFERVGIGEGAGAASEKSLSQSHSEFAKSIQWIQREVAIGLKKAAIVHLALRGYTVEDLKGFDINLTATSAMEELYRIETWQTRVGVMADLKDLGWFPKEWIVTHFTDLSPDEIEELREMEETDAQGGPGGGSPGGLGPMGGGLDMGGDMGDDMGGDIDVDMGLGGEGEGVAEPEAGMGGEAGGETLDLAGLDINGQKSLLVEMMRQGKREKVKKLLTEWHDRLNKPDVDDEIRNGFEFMAETREFDGLNSSSDLIIESKVDEQDREDAIKQNYGVLVESYNVDENDSDIIEDDLPI